MKVQVLFALLCLFLASSSAQLAYVRLVNGFQTSVNFYINNVPQVGNPFLFGVASTYLGIPAGISSFAIANPTTLLPLAAINNEPLSARSYYTVYAYGEPGDETLQIVVDNPLLSLNGPTIRGVNLGLDVAVQLLADLQTANPQTITPLVLNTGNAAPYRFGSVGFPTTVVFTDADLQNTQVSAPVVLPLKSNAAFSIILVGDGVVNPFRVIVTDDTLAGVPLVLPTLPLAPVSVPRSFPGFVKRRKI